jgi:hypothetical protein
MNFTNATANTQSATWKGMKARYIAAVCGLALAASAIAGIATYNGQGSAKPSARPSAIGSGSVSTNADLPTTVYYIVGSQEQALTMQMAVNEVATSGFPSGSTPPDYQVIVADSPEKEQLVALMAQDLNGVAVQTGLITANVIDLR